MTGLSGSGPLVSFIMPARNHAAYVGTALRSILGQSHPHIELIVIDDGSQDDTQGEIARTLAACDRAMRIVFHRQENRGLAPTLIRGLGLARGEFVQFLASDDALFAGMTARLVAEFAGAGPEVAAVGCDGYVFDGGQHSHQPFRQLHPVPLGRNQHRELLVGNWLPAMGLLYRREALLREGGLDPDLVYEDWGLLLNLTRQHRIVQIPDRLFLYRRHDTNISADPARMVQAHHALCARWPAMAGVRHWRQALRAGDLRAILAGLTPGNLDLAARFGLRVIQRRLGLSLRGGAGRARALRRKGAGAGTGRIEIAADCVIGRGVTLTLGPGDLVLGPGCHIGAGVRLVVGEGLCIGAGSFIEAGASLGGEGGVTRIGHACLVAGGAVLAAGTDLGALSVVGPGLAIAGPRPGGSWLLGADQSAGGKTEALDGNF